MVVNLIGWRGRDYQWMDWHGTRNRGSESTTTASRTACRLSGIGSSVSSASRRTIRPRRALPRFGIIAPRCDWGGWQPWRVGAAPLKIGQSSAYQTCRTARWGLRCRKVATALRFGLLIADKRQEGFSFSPHRSWYSAAAAGSCRFTAQPRSASPPGCARQDLCSPRRSWLMRANVTPNYRAPCRPSRGQPPGLPRPGGCGPSTA